MAKQLNCFTESSIFMIGTVKLTNVDGMTQIHLTTAIRNLKDDPRGAWNLVGVFDDNGNVEALRKKHNIEMKKKATSERMQFLPPAEIVAQQAGYIVWKDSKVVIFYSNDLKFTPSSLILEGTELEAVELCPCLSRIRTLDWLRESSLYKT